jgi:hypothetical protein
MAARYWFLGLFAALAFACGNNGGSNGDGGADDGDGGTTGEPDAFEAIIDAPPFGGSCTVGSGTQCSDCVDNDTDGFIDGFDPQCSGPLDRLEDSFATGIPGDNMDATYQDCFFDGDSGGGNDGCSQHVCCLLQAGGSTPNTNDDVSQCMALAPQSNYAKYDRSKCYQPFGNVPVPTKCTMNCGPLAPPGCDCFGCCTVCDAGGCRDVVLNPAVSPNCTQDTISNNGPDNVDNTGDEPCKRCVQVTNCGSTECAAPTCTDANNPSCCTPCPGQCTDPNNLSTCNPPLPAHCNNQTECPTGYQACAADMSCPAGTYCQSDCCVGIIL